MSTPDPLGAAPPDIVPPGSYTSPSSVTLRTPTSRANVNACADAASSQISVSLNTNAIASAT
jgi:hypothetical protein